MKRRVMIVVGALAASAGLAGCQKGSDGQSVRELAEERRDVAEATIEGQQEIAETRREMQQEVAEQRRDMKQEVADERQDVLEAEREVAKASPDSVIMGRVTSVFPVGGALTGDVKSTAPHQLTIQDEDGKSYTLKTDGQTQVGDNGQPRDLNALREGAPVRASFVLQGEERIAREVEVLAEPKK